jgi:hypothetical protein
MHMYMKQKCVIEFLHVERIAPADIYWCLLNIYSDQAVDVTERPHSRLFCTAVRSRNEEHLDQSIHANWWNTTRELCMELNVRFNMLEVTLPTLESFKVCARWIMDTHTGTQRPPNASLSGSAGLSYHTHRTVRVSHLLTFICLDQWKVDYGGNIFLMMPS